MRQKLGIIQALQHDPELAILDEPSEGLDPLMQRAFYAILEDLRARGPDDLLLVARAVRGRAGVRPRGDRPARPARRARGRPDAAGAAQAERRDAARRAGRRRSRASPACRDVRDRPTAGCAAGWKATSGRSWPRSPGTAIHDLTIEPARLEEAFLEFYASRRRRVAGAAVARMNRALFAHTWRANRVRLLIVAVALVVWGTLLPIIYDAFGAQFKDIFDSGRHPASSSPSSAAATSSR